MRRRPRSSAFLLSAVLSLCLHACAGPEPAPAKGPRPIKLAVIAAPEVGADPAALGSLQAAITRLTIEPELSFILVPGPLLAPSAPKEALEDLKSTLEYATVPLYVSFAPVSSAAPAASAVTREDVLAAFETHGPGPERREAYRVAPATAPDVSIVGVGPDGRPPLEPAAPKVKLVVAFAAAGVAVQKDALLAEVLVRAVKDPGAAPAPGASPWLEIAVPPLARDGRVHVVTCDGGFARTRAVPIDPKEEADLKAMGLLVDSPPRPIPDRHR